MFDKIYVINLKEANERRKIINSEFEKIGMNFSFFEAYDINKAKKYVKDLGIKPHSIKTDFWWKRLGCKISHVECLNDAVKNNYKKILVLEDDNLFRDGFKEYLDIYFKQVPEDWGILLLGYYIKNKENVINQNVSYKINENIYTVTETHGAHCIIYNIESENFSKYYKALTKKMYLEKHYDLEMHEICNELDIPRYAVYPQKVAQFNGFSYLSNREKEWDLEEDNPRFDILKSGTVYPYKWKIIKNQKFENNKEYFVLQKGKELKAIYRNGYFVFNKKPLDKIIYYREI